MANYTDGCTRVCGLIGNPVKHTLSPLIHNTLAHMLGIDLVYVPFEVKEENVGDAIRGAKALDIFGLNVTIPHKSAVIPYLEEIDPLAKGIGAVNTLVRTENGGFKGYNTDMTGLYHAMTDEDVVLEGKKIIILGAGGVARPAAFLCGSKGASEIYILNRTYDRALEVADEVNRALAELGTEEKLTSDGLKADGGVTDIEKKVIPMPLSDYKKLLLEGEKYIVLQCTSVGLFPDVNSAVIEDEEFYSHVSYAIDMVYRPVNTKFMRLAAKAGAKSFSGLKMLLYQGIDAFELWNKSEGRDISITKEQADEVYKLLEMEVLGASNIILEGFMGSGKTTVSEILSDKLDLELLDTDQAIEEAEGRSINEIFAADGEAAFRSMETDLVNMVVSEHLNQMVVSLGGGLPLREENRQLLKKAGKIVYLRTRPETVYERLKGDDTRPLLKTEDPQKRIRELLEERSEKYETLADIIIDTDGKDASDIANEIIAAIGL
ncbi:MAG: shikimate dehydrogenase [Butyrivibrio sp.]|nr:shikimate dehydrogenase [Butyrivibrio sp.]